MVRGQMIKHCSSTQLGGVVNMERMNHSADHIAELHASECGTPSGFTRTVYTEFTPRVTIQ
jgi:hypothetical protein